MKNNIAFIHAILLCICLFSTQLCCKLRAENVSLPGILFSETGTVSTIVDHSKSLYQPSIYCNHFFFGENGKSWKYDLSSGISYWVNNYETCIFPGINEVSSTCHFVWEDCLLSKEATSVSGINYGYAKLLSPTGYDLGWKVRIERIWTESNSCLSSDYLEKRENQKSVPVPYKVILSIDLSGNHISNHSLFVPQKKIGKKPNVKFRPHRIKRSKQMEVGTLNLLTVFVSLSNGQKCQDLLDISDLFKPFFGPEACCRIEITIKDSDVSILRKGFADVTGKSIPAFHIINY